MWCTGVTLIREMICARNQLRRLESPSLRVVLEKRLVSAKAECKVIEAEITALVRASDKRELFNLLTSVPGVGALLACTLIANLRELGVLSRREIASLVGVAPMNNDSGRRRGHRFVVGGRGAIRTVLYMATLTASRFNGAIRTFYDRLRSAGKPAKVALTACMRKLLTILNAMAREGRRWRSGETPATSSRSSSPVRPESQKTECIPRHQHCGARVCQDCHPERCRAGQPGDEEDALQPERQGDVLPDIGDGRA
jgi:Transposase IS116/IS110/IS902 family